MRGHPFGSTPPGALKVPGQRGKGGIEHLSPRNDDGIDRQRRAGIDMLPEHLSNQSFSPVPLHRPPNLPGRDDAEAMGGTAVSHDQEREIAAVQARSPFEDLLKLRATPDTLIPGKRVGLHLRITARAAEGALPIRRRP